MVGSSPAYEESARDPRPNPTLGSGWIVQARPTHSTHATLARIPPSAVGGSFKPGLHTARTRPLPKSHPRQWVDRSSPAYTEHARDLSRNPTHGSGWIVQARPTQSTHATSPEIPPTAVGGSFKPGLHRARTRPSPEFHPRYSGWIVQARPTQSTHATFSRIPPTAVGGSFKPGLRRDCGRLRSSNLNLSR